MIPHPSLGIDRFADGTKDSQRREIVLPGRLNSFPHQRPDNSRCGIEDVDFEFFDHLPETGDIRIGGHAFEHDRSGADRERPVQNIGVAGDPADICGAPVDIVVLDVKDQFTRMGGIGEIPAGGMNNTFRRAGAAAGVEDKCGVLGIHTLRLTLVGNIVGGNGFVPPEITSVLY